MEIAVFDDNESALHTLEEYIDSYYDTAAENDYDIFSFTDKKVFEDYCRTAHPDIAFIDIAVSGDSKFGLRCAEKLREGNENTHIIFVTVLAEYMPLSFEGFIRPTHYLVKPISREKINELLERICEQRKKKQIVLKNGSSVYRINMEDILYCVQSKNKMTVYTEKSMIEVYRSLKSIFSEFDGRFMFADKSLIVNSDKIIGVESKTGRITMSDGKQLEVSVRNRKRVKMTLTENNRQGI